MALQAFNAEVFGYREIFDYANDAMIIHCAHTGDVLEVNRQACQLYGIEREALIGLRVGDLASSAGWCWPWRVISLTGSGAKKKTVSAIKI